MPQTKTINKKLAEVLDYQNQPRKLPDSWYQAAGLLRHKKKAILQHLARVRKEWARV